MPTEKKLAYLALIATILIWGGSFVAASIGMQELTPYQLATVRFVVSSAIFLPLLIVMRRRGQRLERSDLPLIVLLAFLGVTTYYYIQFAAVKLAGATTTGVLITLTPVWIAVCGHFFLRERLDWRGGLGIALGCLGAVTVATKGRIDFLSGSGMLAGAGLTLLNTFGWATYTVLGRKIVRRYDPVFLTACIALIGTAMLVPLSLLIGAFPFDWSFQPRTWLAIIYLGPLSSVLGYTFWYSALKYIEAPRVAVFQYFQPLVSIIVAWLLLGELPHASLLIGGVIVISGLVLVSASRRVALETSA